MDIILKFDKDVFNVETQARGLSAESATFNKQIAEMNSCVEVLDRFDDFSDLKIDPANYEKRGKYGIQRTEAHLGNSVIFPHQRRAAHEFLSGLRGFGLLADVVGSGKTFEACVVLSELAVRGNIRSILIVTPAQVYDTWVDVLENKFGLGAGQICHAASASEWEERKRRAEEDGVKLSKRYHKRVTVENLGSSTEETDGFICPKEKVWIASWEDFCSWSDPTAGVLFDVVVVDEAHHLCEERGMSARALRLLAMMMEVKKRANRSYCLLLSATPHSGNLEQMFRLWYFIRCKGGNPSDYEEKDESACTAEYRSEREYYRNFICRGASTVAEFIKRVKVGTVTLETSELRAKFDKYLETLRRKGEKVPAFEKMSDGERWQYVNEFLRENPALEGDVVRAVSDAYHNGVLRSIMIRQPNQLPKKKNIVNTFFIPTAKSGTIKLTYHGQKLSVRTDRLGGDKAISYDGEDMSLRTYCARYAGNADENEYYAELVMAILDALGVTDPSEFAANEAGKATFVKVNSKRFYRTLLRSVPREIQTEFVPVGKEEDISFDCKMKRLKELLAKHSKDRVIVFFDYDLDRKARFEDRVIEQLRADSAVAPRLLVGERPDKEITAAFNEKSDAVLIVCASGFTEGANLQKCNIIVNFQITPDPLAMDQRIGRIFRIGQEKDVIVYSLADMCALEGYVLMYFARIGLLDSSSGDATILAGSNNERMVTLRCPVCRNVRLMSLEDYVEAERLDSGNLYCTNTAIDHPDATKNGTRMNEISVYDFKCDTCNRTFTRSVVEEGYFCMSSNNSGKGMMFEHYSSGGAESELSDRMCNSGEMGDRNIYCRKICAIAHCSRFTAGDMKGKCAALDLYKRNRNVAETELMLLCDRCPNKSLCGECRVNVGENAIKRCATVCSNDRPQCRPRPHVLRFDENWEADCPACAAEKKRGKIKRVNTRTFATYIRGAWNFRHDNGAAFCENLEKEAYKVGEIKEILKHDEEDE